MSLIDDFLEQYRRMFGIYERAAELGRRQCEVGLCSVRTQITSRAKSFDSLRRKLQCRAREKSYGSLEEIAEDIPDLAGVRIALYFPGDLCKVEQFLASHFDVEPSGVRVFPQEVEAAPGDDAPSRRFPGYTARHFRVRSRAENLARADSGLAGLRLEIQVASVLMHAWAEVEHDLVYKPRARQLSEAETAILDEVNGLVLAGEAAFARLQRSLGEQATWGDPFANQYELAACLRATIPGLAEAEDRGEVLMGGADVLLQLLCRSGLDSSDRLAPCLEGFQIDAPAPTRVAERIIDHLLRVDPTRAADYVRARDYVNRPRGVVLQADQHAELARFLNRWFVVARVADTAGESFGREAKLLVAELAGRALHAPVVEVARRWCDDILRGVEVPSAEELAATTRGLEELLRTSWAETPAEVRDFIVRSLVPPAEDIH